MKFHNSTKNAAKLNKTKKWRLFVQIVYGTGIRQFGQNDCTKIVVLTFLFPPSHFLSVSGLRWRVRLSSSLSSFNAVDCWLLWIVDDTAITMMTVQWHLPLSPLSFLLFTASFCSVNNLLRLLTVNNDVDDNDTATMMILIIMMPVRITYLLTVNNDTWCCW